MNRTENNVIEPPWGGFERSILMTAFWVLIVLVLIPFPLAGLFWMIYYIGMGEAPYFTIVYVFALFIGSIPILKKMHKEGRVYLYVGGQQAAILTHDIPSWASREHTDSREETTQISVKLAEGGHVLSPFDQLYVKLPIEVDYQVALVKFRVSIGNNKDKKRDLLVKSAVANFETDSENLMRLARISPHEHIRKANLEKSLGALVERLLGEECRRVAATCDEPADKSEEISNKVEEKLIAEVRGKHYGVKLKNFILGDIDKPEDVEKARDQAAAVEVLGTAAGHLMEVTNVPGTSPQNAMTPMQAMDQTYVGAGIKKSTREEKSHEVAPNTLEILGKLAMAIIEALKK